MSKEEVERVLEILNAYSAAFPNDGVPKAYWHGDLDELHRLMQAAIVAGRALTADDLMAAQGLEPPPPGTPV